MSLYAVDDPDIPIRAELHRAREADLGARRDARQEHARLLLAVRSARKAGWSHGDIGLVLGVDRSRAAQLAREATV